MRLNTYYVLRDIDTQQFLTESYPMFKTLTPKLASAAKFGDIYWIHSWFENYDSEMFAGLKFEVITIFDTEPEPEVNYVRYDDGSEDDY